jgi:hypothetical protein
MVIHDLDIETVPSAPLEAESPLIVDPDAVLSLAVASQGFEAVSRDRGKIVQARCRVQGFELAPGSLLDGLETPYKSIFEQILGISAPE